jgi:hypothetical protein
VTRKERFKTRRQATYPLRNDDGTLRRNKGMAEYPTTLPIFRPWLDEKTFQ